MHDSRNSSDDQLARHDQLLTEPVRTEQAVVSDRVPLRSFLIVGIGASAGGLEAFRRLLGALPPDTGMAYVLVQHLDPCHESILAGLLSEATAMEVSEVKGDLVVAPNHVYVIRPSKGLILTDGQLKLVPRGPPGAMHMPIDSFLKTLADVRGSEAIGVVLSGMGSDGTLGLQAIEAQGGIAFAQEPASAKNEDMPRSAISAGHVDFILAPEDIARELARLGRHPYLARPFSAPAAVPEEDRPTAASDVPREADRMLLARFGSAGVVVDANLRVLEFRGDTAPFLDHGQGKASLDLEHLLRRGLLMDLRQAVDEARLADATVRKRGLQVRYQDQLSSVSVEVIPIKGRAVCERCLLILFSVDEVTIDALEQSRVAPAVDNPDAKDSEILRLSQALGRTTEYMHTLVREHESSLEALQSTTEEALSGNEELQSLNEELQTTKEEIQSANEELATLNQELQDRNGLLARSNDEIQRGLDDANALVDTVPQPLVILDGELRVEKANVAFYESFEVKVEDTRGRRLADLGNRQWNQPALLAGLKVLLESGAALEDLKVEAEFPAIGQRTMSLNARRLHPERGARGRLLLAIQDRTVLEQAERERAALLALEHHARTRAEAADQLKNQFVATVSHELRGPLNVISGWLSVLLAAGKSIDPAVLAKALGAIGRGVRAQGRLISDLLDHSRIITGKLELSRMPLDLLVVAEAALGSVRAAAQAKDIALQLSGDPTTSVVLGDADRLQQVFWNLFLNAVKFTQPGGSVSIVVGRVGNQVRVTVSDTGRGIPEEFLPHVFERFRQAEGSSSRTQPGLGLGLTLVRELVELHGGTVHAHSAGKDQGAVFTVLLPIPAVLLPPPEEVTSLPSVAPDSERPPAMRAEALLALPSDLLRGARVLVVDDEGDARDAVVRLLERYGAHVRPATSVTEAMADLERELPDVIVSDIGMPGEDGYELIRRVRLLPVAQGGELPLLALSAYVTEEHRKKVLQSGFQMHLEKPVAPDELVTVVARLAGPVERRAVRSQRELSWDSVG